MNKIRDIWSTLSERFSDFSDREKWLITFAGWATFIFLLLSFLVEPVQIKNNNYNAQLASLKSETITLNNKIISLNKMLTEDPNKRVDREYKALLEKNQELSEQLSDVVGSLVTPTAMANLLENVLKQTKGLKLILLESQPNEPIMLDDVAGDAVGYYMHPVKIVLTGNYFNIQQYLSNLEQMPVKYYWRSFDYKVEGYPQARLELVVFTLGAKKEFIGG